jgi:ABC-type lipoprotein export system ATPase subunit
MAPLLSFADVTKRYPGGRHTVAVLDKVSLEIHAGEFIGIWSPRREGKSTLLRIAAGIEPPDEGAVHWDGRSVAQMGRRERSRMRRRGGVALISSLCRIHINRPAVDYVALSLLGDSTTLRRGRPLARAALGVVGAAEYGDAHTDQLSLGERIRVELACALVREPRLLLIDEPAVLPNPLESEELYALLRSLGREKDRTMVIASEDLAALQRARRVLSLSNGVLRSMDSGEGVVLPFPEQQSG